MALFVSDNSSRRGFLATAVALGTGALAGSTLKDSIGREKETPLAPPDKQPAGLALPEIAEKKVGWAIVGLGQLALEEVMPAFRLSRLSRPVALVSGHPDKAKRVANAYGVDPRNIYSYEDYGKLAENQEVEVIYIILPNSMHAEYTIRGLKAGKHVLCEKPMATSVAECESMIAAANEANKKLMIAYRLRYEPFNQKVIELCQQHKLGKLKSILATNGQNVMAPNIRLSSKLGGGPLGDVGIYCLNAARYITGQEPIEVTAFSHQPSDDPRFREVPESVTFQLKFKDGVLAHCGSSFGTSESRYYRVECTEGCIELDDAFAYRGQQLRVRTKESAQQLKIVPVNHFAQEMDHLSECILKDKEPRTPGAEGLADMRAIAAIEQSIREQRTIILNTK